MLRSDLSGQNRRVLGFGRGVLGALVISMVALACVGCGSRPEQTAAETAESSEPAPSNIERAQDLLAQGRASEALELAQQVLVAAPDDITALRVVAGASVLNGRLEDAAEIAITLSQLEVPDPPGELLRAFDLHLRAGNPQAAEADLRDALKLAPEDPRVHRMLAQLLNSQGRRYEACQHVITLARLGTLTSRELLSLVDVSGPFQLISFQDVLPPSMAGQETVTLFDLGRARYEYISDNDPEAALRTTSRLQGSVPDSPAVAAFRGRLIAENKTDDSFAQWIEKLPPGTTEHPEYWRAVGIWMNRQDLPREAVRALGEALRLDPTDRQSLREMSGILDQLGESEKARRVRESLADLDKVFRLAAQADPQQAFWIAGQLQKLARHWESLGWYRHWLQMQGNLQQREEELNKRHHQIRQWEEQAGTDQIQDAQLSALLGFDIDSFPLPKIEAIAASQPVAKPEQPGNTLRFRDIAVSIGLETTFVSDFPLDSTEFYLYQSNGGGLAVLDFDLDGRCDLYVAQSGGNPQLAGTSTPNQLFRHLPDGTVDEVTIFSATGDRGFAQGVCAGDVNQDGFADLLVANIGRNALYINQGDGTFVDHSDAIVGNSDRWTSSLVVGDLDGDQLPELVEVNYLDDPLIFERTCKGKDLACTPQRFRAATDRVFLNDGRGGFEVWSGADRIEELPNYGFGAVIANFDDQNGNELFISNDGDRNHFWKSTETESQAPRRYMLRESASVAGCNVGASGIVQACMGIASGDFDRNGLLDLLITNFHNEPVNLFLLNKSGFFVDEARKYNLVQPSRDVLGFGTQAADFDNDGWLDAAVLNGHIYDARYAGIPFRMTSQLFRGGRSGFSLQDAAAAGPYWNREQLGRTLALWDFDRDGRMDLVANHLDQPIAVLRNASQAEHWVQFELVGVTSERGAIGARVVVHAGGEHWTGWRTGGDGYMCTNESLIHFGIGGAQKIDKVEIHWPSGNVQTITSIDADERYLVVEGQEQTRT